MKVTFITYKNVMEKVTTSMHHAHKTITKHIILSIHLTL